MRFGRTLALLAALVGVLATVAAIVPVWVGVWQLAVLVWFAAPGIILVFGVYRGQEGRRIAALLAGPAWGYALSLTALLALWAAGVRAFGWLMLAPLAASIIAWPLGRFIPALTPPALTRRDLAAWALVVLAVPLIVGLPFAHVGMDLPEGRAYRAYFTADFVWQMAVVSEVSKGDMPPRNPYYRDDSLHYYWMTHLLAAAEHRAAGRSVTVDQILLVDALWSALAFVGFFYFFVRHFVERPWAAAWASIGVMIASSFEGIYEIWLLGQRGQPLDALRYVNIDAITRWVYQAMPIDGLDRLLLYQPQHQMAYLLGFSALLVLVEARDCSRASVLFLAGIFLALGLLVSPFAAGMLAVATAAYAAWRLSEARQWRAFITCAAAAAAPMVVALVVTRLLRYVDAGTPLVALGVNRMATRHWQIATFLSFGPVLLVAAAGLAAAIARRAARAFVPVAIVLAMCTIMYFLVDVPDHQGVYVGWHVGKIVFIALTPLYAFALQTFVSRPGWIRAAAIVLVAAITAAALPTTIIDIYNTQDVWNRANGPGFRWTVLLSPDEVKGLDWIKRWTPAGARVQVEPFVRGRDTWAYVPAFAERRMSAGLPISMIPLAKYERASERIRAVYRSTSALEAHQRSAAECIDYLVVGPPERAAYPQFQPLLDEHPEWFAPAFRNSALAIYTVSSGGTTDAGCSQ